MSNRNKAAYANSVNRGLTKVEKLAMDLFAKNYSFGSCEQVATESARVAIEQANIFFDELDKGEESE